MLHYCYMYMLTKGVVFFGSKVRVHVFHGFGGFMTFLASWVVVS